MEKIWGGNVRWTTYFPYVVRKMKNCHKLSKNRGMHGKNHEISEHPLKTISLMFETETVGPCWVWNLTASLLKEIVNISSYCAKYYLLSDTKITHYLKEHHYYLKVFWLIYMHLISCMWKPPSVHITCMLVTLHIICWVSFLQCFIIPRFFLENQDY